MKHHKISLFTAILLNINIMVGSGILIGPKKMAEIAGRASFLAWPLVALLFLPMVMSTVTLSRLFPGAGGFYSYAKNGLGRTAGFLSGWLYLVGYTFAIGAEFLALRNTLLVAVGHNWFTDNALLFHTAIIGGSFLLNLLSLKVVGNLLNSLTISKLLPLGICILLIPFVWSSSFGVSAPEIAQVPYALPMAMFGYFGFEYCTSLSHLIENNEKNAPRAILIGFLITALIYTLFHIGVLNIMGADNLMNFGAPAFGEFVQLPIPYLKELLAFLIPLASILAIFAAANGMLNANAVLLNSMAEEKLFKTGGSLLLALNRFSRPWVALLFQSVVALALVISIPDISVMFNLCNLGVFMAFIFPFISLFVIQRQRNASYGALAFTLLALGMVLGLSLYSLLGFGETAAERLLGALPLFGAILMGIGMLSKEY